MIRPGSPYDAGSQADRIWNEGYSACVKRTVERLLEQQRQGVKPLRDKPEPKEIL